MNNSKVAAENAVLMYVISLSLFLAKQIRNLIAKGKGDTQSVGKVVKSCQDG